MSNDGPVRIEETVTLADEKGKLTRVTFWGVTDGDSWLNFFPVRGRTNYPLLFDRQRDPRQMRTVLKDTKGLITAETIGDT